MSSLEVQIHATAIVHPKAKLGVGVKIGPFSIIGCDVELGDHVEVVSHAIVDGWTQVGEYSRVWPFATIGNAPQDKKFNGERTRLTCGSHNQFREYCNVNVGTEGGGGFTRVGSHNLLMVNTHVAHDCIVGDHCILANGVSLAGHVELRNGVVLGGHSAVHQFCRVGSLAMFGAGAIAVQDVPAYTTVHGNHASPVGLNLIGLKRADFSKEAIHEIKSMYKILYSSSLTLQNAIETIEKEIPTSTHKEEFLHMLKTTTRGLCR